MPSARRKHKKDYVVNTIYLVMLAIALTSISVFIVHVAIDMLTSRHFPLP